MAIILFVAAMAQNVYLGGLSVLAFLVVLSLVLRSADVSR